ncbi:MAG: hypothetical protein FJZ47_13710 [Candidatus Tectomicrobia bacterium]|uniref:Peptidase M28 domain-containing protein n=1 Tax=Tectimicrobiota bacterium TaxID=2528274 RepID=A0A937W450_UNCTE|nr:hypothetical protein [Candidatus Tectomicrobia bacterium]
MRRLGAHLYQLVQAYAALGDHRTGTSVDQATLAWFTTELSKRGARVDNIPYQFERYVASCRLTANATDVEALPLYYEAVGTVHSSRLQVAELAFDANLDAPQLDEVIACARMSGADAAILATTGAGGYLVALNRAPVLGSGFPIMLVPGSALPLLRQAALHLDLNARLEPSASATVIGHLGPGDTAPPVVVTTPLSGWFRCAGERGTGIAIALQLATDLAERWPVMVVGTTGHELHYLGLQRFLAAHALHPAAVIFLGASVATTTLGPESGSTFAAFRQALTTAGEGLAQRLEKVLAPARFPVRSNPAQWLGEGEAWVRLRTPLLSLTNRFPLFHTADDLPAHATSPEQLAVTHTAVNRAAQLFLEESLRN